MLIPVAGITGFVGLPCAEAALTRGRKVWGLACNADKLLKDICDQLEGFETLSHIYDIDAMNWAVKGVDAVICAFAGVPKMFVESQLLLLRAAESAKVKIFHASSWNYNWRSSPGSHKIYDDIRALAHHVEISSSIKLIYMFTGAIAEYYFKKSLIDWDPKTKTFNFHGPPTALTCYTTAKDIGNYVLEAITSPDASSGGYVFVQSFKALPQDIVRAYSTARNGRLAANLNCLGSVEDVKTKLDQGRATHGKREWYKYLWYCYQYHILMRSWDYNPVDVVRFSNVKQTDLEEFFCQNPDV